MYMVQGLDSSLWDLYLGINVLVSNLSVKCDIHCSFFFNSLKLLGEMVPTRYQSLVV